MFLLLFPSFPPSLPREQDRHTFLYPVGCCLFNMSVITWREINLHYPSPHALGRNLRQPPQCLIPLPYVSRALGVKNGCLCLYAAPSMEMTLLHSPRGSLPMLPPYLTCEYLLPYGHSFFLILSLGHPCALWGLYLERTSVVSSCLFRKRWQAEVQLNFERLPWWRLQQKMCGWLCSECWTVTETDMISFLLQCWASLY